jgi:hypothetical protein
MMTMYDCARKDQLLADAEEVIRRQKRLRQTFDKIVEKLRAERDALLALLTEVRCYVEQDDSGLSRKGKADMELLDRIDAARKGVR